MQLHRHRRELQLPGTVFLHSVRAAGELHSRLPGLIPIGSTSGLPDDSREAAERDIEWRLRDLRGRVKVVRAVIAGTPGLSELLAGDWRRAAWFCARFGVAVELVRHGVPAVDPDRGGITEGTLRAEFEQAWFPRCVSGNEIKVRATASWRFGYVHPRFLGCDGP